MTQENLISPCIDFDSWIFYIQVQFAGWYNILIHVGLGELAPRLWEMEAWNIQTKF